MPPTRDWQAELPKMLARREPESLYLEYKARDSLLGNNNKRSEEVSKDTSAFMNSDGGALVYGVRDAKGTGGAGGTPEPFDPKKDGYNRGEIAKEQIEDIVTGNIQPKPGSDLFRVIEVDLSGRLVFVVDVAKSMQGAFQAKDKRYYMRFNFKTEPMDHWQIEDVRNRTVGPDLQLVAGFTDTWEQRSSFPPNPVPIHFGIKNIGRGVPEAALLEIGLSPENYSSGNPPHTLYAGTRRATLRDPAGNPHNVHLRWFQLPWNVQSLGNLYQPLFSMMDPHYATQISFNVADYSNDLRGYIIWRLQAHAMAFKQGWIGIYEHGHQWSLAPIDRPFEIEVLGEPIQG